VEVTLPLPNAGVDGGGKILSKQLVVDLKPYTVCIKVKGLGASGTDDDGTGGGDGRGNVLLEGRLHGEVETLETGSFWEFVGSGADRRLLLTLCKRLPRHGNKTFETMLWPRVIEGAPEIDLAALDAEGKRIKEELTVADENEELYQQMKGRRGQD
jgi:hypothetical protein